MIIRLTQLPAGASARVAECPKGMAGLRLEALGLRPGVVVTKVSGMPFAGPVVVLVSARRLAVGFGMASRVMVETKP